MYLPPPPIPPPKSAEIHESMSILFYTNYTEYNFYLVYFVLSVQNHQLLVCKNDVEVAQFQSNSPQYLPISEEFWKALAKLPTVYDYAAYRKVLERFGTDYVSEGSLGGSIKAVVSINQETARHRGKESPFIC